MACNGWNHAPDCSCGWGGVWYGAGYQNDGSSTWHWQRSDSYATPNARCPMCQVRVYFYRSHYGGTAYFDELGPPWPKHPCMDTRAAATGSRKSLLPAIQRASQPSAGQRRESGWRPLICDEVRRHERCNQIVVMKVASGQGSPSTLYAIVEKRLDYRTPFLARVDLTTGSIEISTLDALATHPGEVRFFAVRSLDDLPQHFRDAARDVLPPAQHDAWIDEPTTLSEGPSTPFLPAPKKPRPDMASIPVTRNGGRRHQRADGPKPTIAVAAAMPTSPPPSPPPPQPAPASLMELVPLSEPAMAPVPQSMPASTSMRASLPGSDGPSRPAKKPTKAGVAAQSPLSALALAFQTAGVSLGTSKGSAPPIQANGESQPRDESGLFRALLGPGVQRLRSTEDGS